jgi:hypothetical protein
VTTGAGKLTEQTLCTLYLSANVCICTCRRSIDVLSSSAVGFAMPFPTMSLATCRAPCSKMATSCADRQHPSARYLRGKANDDSQDRPAEVLHLADIDARAHTGPSGQACSKS